MQTMVIYHKQCRRKTFVFYQNIGNTFTNLLLTRTKTTFAYLLSCYYWFSDSKGGNTVHAAK